MEIPRQFVLEGEFYSVKAWDNHTEGYIICYFMSKEDAERKKEFLKSHWDWTKISYEYMQ